MQFRWNEWNREHIGVHGVDPEEAEIVVRGHEQPYPLWRPDDKWLIRGRGRGGRLLQVVYVLDEDLTVYVIHARPLTEREKRQYRRKGSS
jgi:uncharacterized DUF497 family protein